MMSARHLPFRGTGTASRTPPQAPLASQSRLHRAIGHARSSALQPSQPILPAQSRIHRASRRTHSCQVSAYVTTSAPSQSTSKTQTQAQLAQQIVVNYRTGWSQAVLHGSLCGAEWSDYPLVAVPSAPVSIDRAQCTWQPTHRQPHSLRGPISTCSALRAALKTKHPPPRALCASALGLAGHTSLSQAMADAERTHPANQCAGRVSLDRRVPCIASLPACLPTEQMEARKVSVPSCHPRVRQNAFRVCIDQQEE